jgi:predicted nucleic acid-binding protein
MQATLAHTTLSFTEMASTIEAIACEHYARSHPGVTRKQFRRIAGERRVVRRAILASWQQINQFSAPLEIHVDTPISRAVLARTLHYPLDGYDALFLHTAHREGITQVISDDRDFVAVEGIQVFTAKGDVIDQARGVGKLVTR